MLNKFVLDFRRTVAIWNDADTRAMGVKSSVQIVDFMIPLPRKM